jgi:hypothetical protein
MSIFQGKFVGKPTLYMSYTWGTVLAFNSAKAALAYSASIAKGLFLSQEGKGEIGRRKVNVR